MSWIDEIADVVLFFYRAVRAYVETPEGEEHLQRIVGEVADGPGNSSDLKSAINLANEELTSSTGTYPNSSVRK